MVFEEVDLLFDHNHRKVDEILERFYYYVTIS